MFDQLSDRLEKVMKFLRGEGKVTEKNLAEALKMIRLALLEADVNYKVVKDLEQRIREKALGEAVMDSLSPAQQVIKIVRDELTAVLGGEKRQVNFSSSLPSVFMLVGLQGSGKTTTSGKLARWAAGVGKKPILASIDLKRPAAQDQLRILAESQGIPFHAVDVAAAEADPVGSMKGLLTSVRNRGFDLLIVDTAGRLHVDEELMAELKLVRDTLDPCEVIYVADAMTGQDALKSAKAFEEKIGLTSVILTKLDGDARGGAALSVVAVTGKPIKFIGVGEKMDKLEPFHPDRMASRIMGMGDILGLIEKAELDTDRKEAEDLARKLKKQEFSLADFRKQLVQMKKMGSMTELLDHLPKAGPFKGLSDVQVDDSKMKHYGAIIDSMTPWERDNPRLINGSRRLRIARGSGRTVQEVNQLLKSFLQMRKMMTSGPFAKMFRNGPRP